MKFGLSENSINSIIQVLESNPKVDKALVFGSRAKGNYRDASDIDIAVKGVELNFDDMLQLGVKLDDLNLPYKVDLINYHTIKEPDLKDHIDRVGIEMYSKWKECKLDDIIDVKHGFAFSGKHITEEPTNNILVTPGNIQIGGGFKSSKFKYYNADFPSDYILNSGDIVVTMTDLSQETDTLGYSAKIPKQNGINYLHNQRIGLIQFKSNKVNKDFIYWLLRTKEYQGFIIGSASGTSIMHTAPTRIKEYSFSLPSLKEQTAIASILSSLDDKIDLLQRQNKTLEQLAETLFRQWFVEDAEESWEVGTLNDIISVKGGTTPSTTKSEYWDGNINWTSPRDLSNVTSVFLFKTERKITEKGLAKIGSGLLPIGTVLLSSRAPIGYLTITEIPVAINQGYIAILCDKGVSNYFIYLWCKANMETIENAGNGSVFQEISKTSFKGLEILIPPKEKLNQCDMEIEPVFQKIKSNQSQIRTLIQTRDTLLPKLMSGEVRVHL